MEYTLGILAASSFTIIVLLSYLVSRLYTAVSDRDSMIMDLELSRESEIHDAVELALRRSKSVIKGQVWEQMFPLSTENPYNTSDMKFLGQPIDYIIFDGLSDGREVEVVVLEIKTGKSRINNNQRAIRDAIKNGRIRWETLTLGDDTGGSEDGI